MKEHEIFKAIGDIDEAYIKESEDAPEKPIKLGMGIGKTLMVAAAIILMLGAALILPNLLSGEGIRPVDIGNTYPTADEIASAYWDAHEAESWFRVSTLGSIAADQSDAIEIDGIPYWRVTRFDTYAEFDEHLHSLFSDEIVENLLSTTPAYTEYDGKLYSTPADGGNSMPISEGRVEEIIFVDSDTIHVIIAADVTDYADRLNPDPKGEIIGTETITLIYEKIGDKWVFTAFPDFSHENFEKYQGMSDADEGRPTDEQIKRTFAAALEARSWFTDATLAVIEGNKFDKITVDGVEYWYIPKFDTLDEFHKYLCQAFTKERASELLNGSLYVERNGKVYARPIHMNPSFLTSPSRIKDITDIDEDTIYITVEVDIVDHADKLNPSPVGKILDVKDMTVYYEKVDGKWIFTEFLSYINLEKYQGASIDTTAPYDINILTVDGVKIPIPQEYPTDTLGFKTEENDRGLLVTVVHSEEHSKHGGGEILRIYRLLPGQYEYDFQQGSLIVGGSYALATDGEYYYTMSVPTDVQGDPLGTGFGSFMEISGRCQKLVRDYFAKINGFREIDPNELYSAKDYTYEGNHKFYCFYPYGKGTDLFYLLVASQPVKQGEGGIWCVERWYSASASGTPLVGNTEHKTVWTLHLTFPSERTELYSVEYYEILQEEYDNGEKQLLGDPESVVEEWGKATFGDTFLAGYFEEIDHNPVVGSIVN